jgi:hypothetical protein
MAALDERFHGSVGSATVREHPTARPLPRGNSVELGEERHENRVLVRRR